MDNNTLKNIADYLSNAFIKSETEFEAEFAKIKNKIKSAHDGYIINCLCDVYREAKQGLCSMSEAKQRQRDVFAAAENIW